MIADAVDTAVTLGWALAVAVTLALYTLTVTVWAAFRALQEGVTAAVSLAQHSSGRREPRTRPEAVQAPSEPHTPAWARTDEEAA